MSNSFSETQRMPVLFVGHGSPMNAIEENEFTKGWREIAGSIPRPSAVLCISAHWETSGTFVNVSEKPLTIHDFGGFPRELFEVEYPASGSPELAELTRSMIRKTKVELDKSWGLDHGCWSVLRHFYPKADIPVVQLSLDYDQGPQYHYDLAKDLASLRKKGVLIVGSGNIVHNLRMVDWQHLNDSAFGYDWALEANEKMKSYILSGNHQALINFRSESKASQLAIPTPEHFLPLLYILALKEENEKISFFNDKIVAGSLSMTSVRIE